MSEEKYHTLLRRLAAGIIDLWPVIPFVVIAFLWDDLPTEHIGSLILSIGTYLVSTAYFVFMHARTGQTVGKKLFGVRVVRAEDEGSINLKLSFRRESPLILFLAVFVICDVIFFVVGEESSPAFLLNGYLILDRLLRIWNFADALCTLFNPRRRSLHDYIGRTVVVRTR